MAFLIEETTNQTESQQIKSKFHVGFCWEGKTGVPEEKRLQTEYKENQQTHSTNDGSSGNQTQAMLVEGECFQHCTNTASPLQIMFHNNYKQW